MANIRYFGVGVWDPQILNLEAFHKDTARNNGFHLRVALDVRLGTGSDVYWKIWELCQAGPFWLPVIVWTNADNPRTYHIPNGNGEIQLLQDYCTWVGQALRDLRNAGAAYTPDLIEAWNEPNTPAFGGGTGGMSVNSYVGGVLKPVRAGIRTYYSQCAIMVGGLAFGRNDGRLDAYDFITQLYDDSGINWAQYFEAIGIHPYGKTNTSTWTSEPESNATLQRAKDEATRAIFAANNREPLIITETGRNTVDWTPAQQQAFVDGLAAWARTQPALKGFSCWHLRDPGAGEGSFAYKGLHYNNNAAKPAWTSYDNYNQSQGFPMIPSIPLDP